MFEPFFTTKAPGRGTGLGLATVRGLVERAGGRVTVSSQVGAGAEFTILLPATRVAASAGRDATAAARRGGGERILVVDDEDAIRNVLCRALASAGYVPASAPSGEDALDAMRNGRFDLVLSDVRLPDLAGPDFVGRRRSDGVAAPVVFMTGCADAAGAAARDAGAGVLRKPFTDGAMLAAIGAALDRARS
jgi:CheY-like chemotaxis protein